jgi:hypothetical protein
MLTQQQIDSFYEFASSQIANGGKDLSLDELYCMWRAKNPTPIELAESVAALQSAYAEMAAGDDGRPARAALRETCERLGLVIDE